SFGPLRIPSPPACKRRSSAPSWAWFYLTLFSPRRWLDFGVWCCSFSSCLRRCWGDGCIQRDQADEQLLGTRLDVAAFPAPGAGSGRRHDELAGLLLDGAQMARWRGAFRDPHSLG